MDFLDARRFDQLARVVLAHPRAGENDDLFPCTLDELSNSLGAGERVGRAAKGGSGGVLGNGKGAKLDYAATLSEAYDNLDKMLGSEGIKQLSNDTQKLMKQQQDLFGTMEQFVPILENAQNMLNKLDMSGINKIAGMANSLGLGGGGKGGSAPVAANA